MLQEFDVQTSTPQLVYAYASTKGSGQVAVMPMQAVRRENFSGFKSAVVSVRVWSTAKIG